MAIFGDKANNKLAAIYFNKWLKFHNGEAKDVIRRNIELEQQKNEDLTAQYEAKKAVLERLKLLDAKRKEIQAAKDANEKAQLEYATRAQLRLILIHPRAHTHPHPSHRKAKAEEDLVRLLDNLKNKQDGVEEEREKTKNEMLEDVMAILKAKCLNYHLDYTLIQKVRDQTKQIPVQKIFLEAHMSIKRVVIDVSKYNQVAGQRWKGLDRNIDNIPDHHKSTILHAIKTMIICYDLMSTDLKDNLETDDEILENTDYLEAMVNIAIKHRDAKVCPVHERDATFGAHTHTQNHNTAGPRCLPRQGMSFLLSSHHSPTNSICSLCPLPCFPRTAPSSSGTVRTRRGSGG